MRIFSLVLLLVSSIVWAQAPSPQQPDNSQAGQAPNAARHDDDTEPPPASAANVPLDAPVITVAGLCDKPSTSSPAAKDAKPAGTPDCKTIVTRAQFEKLVNALNPQMAGPMRKQLAETYPRLLVFADQARELGLDRDPAFLEMMRFATIQLLSQRLNRHMQEIAGNISDPEIENYFKENAGKFQRVELLRIFIPRQRQLGAGGGTAAQNRSADEAAMQAAAEKIHAEAAAGTDFQQLQKEAFDAAGIASTAPKVEMGKLAPGSLPVNHRKILDLDAGQVSAVISDPGGYFIYKVVSKQTVPLSQAKAEIRNSIQSQRMQEATESLTRNIKSQLNQEYFVGAPGPRKSLQPATTQNNPADK